MPRHFELVKNQTRELLENYGPLGVMWFDGDWEEPWTREYGDELYDYLKEIQPSLFINNRVSKGRLSKTARRQPRRTRRLRHARAARWRVRSDSPMGKLHHDLQAMGVEAE